MKQLKLTLIALSAVALTGCATLEEASSSLSCWISILSLTSRMARAIRCSARVGQKAAARLRVSPIIMACARWSHISRCGMQGVPPVTGTGTGVAPIIRPCRG